jgi:hypothetical protein
MLPILTTVRSALRLHSTVSAREIDAFSHGLLAMGSRAADDVLDAHFSRRETMLCDPEASSYLLMEDVVVNFLSQLWPDACLAKTARGTMAVDFTGSNPPRWGQVKHGTKPVGIDVIAKTISKARVSMAEPRLLDTHEAHFFARTYETGIVDAVEHMLPRLALWRTVCDGMHFKTFTPHNVIAAEILVNAMRAARPRLDPAGTWGAQTKPTVAKELSVAPPEELPRAAPRRPTPPEFYSRENWLAGLPVPTQGLPRAGGAATHAPRVFEAGTITRLYSSKRHNKTIVEGVSPELKVGGIVKYPFVIDNCKHCHGAHVVYSTTAKRARMSYSHSMHKCQKRMQQAGSNGI